MARDTFTARAAHWSATHRKTAVLGWLAFVVVAFMLGGAVGTVTLKHEDMGNGDSRAAERVLAQQFPRERAAEQVLIQSRNGGLLGASTAPPSTSSSRACRTRRPWPGSSRRCSVATRVSVPRTGPRCCVTFQITGDPDTAKDRVAPALAATAAVQRAHPGLFVGEFGDASANKAIMKRIQRRLPAGGDHLAAGDAADPRRRLRRARGRRHPAAARHHRGRGGARADRPLQPSDARRRVDQLGDPARSAWRSASTTRSSTCAARARSARGAGRAPMRCRPPRRPPGRAVLFSGFVVMTAMAGMFLMGSQTFASFGVGTVLVVAISLRRVAHRPAGRPVQARRPRRARPDPVPRAHARQGRRVALLGRGRRRRDAPPGRLRRRGRRRCSSRSRSPRSACTRSTRARRASRATCR